MIFFLKKKFQLQIQSELKLELAYFNEKLSVWEPLIEPVMEKENIYQPWELQVKVGTLLNL